MDLDKIAQEFKDSREAKQQLAKEKKQDAKAKEKAEARTKELKQQGSIKQTDLQAVASQALSQMTVFCPSPEQRKLKAKFWAVYKDNPMVEIDQMTPHEFMAICQDARIASWWGVPGFQGWFKNQLEAKEKLEYLFDLALDTLQEILLDPEPKTASAKVNAIKLIAELGNKLPKKNDKPTFIDEEINQLSKEELHQLLNNTEVRRVLEITSKPVD